MENVVNNANRGDLVFKETMTVEQFKKAKGVETIHVKRNPKTGKIFMVYGNTTGAVASKGIPQKPMISIVSDGLSEFAMLHEEAQGAPDVAVL